MSKVINDIIDLKSHELIDEAVANRQKNVILKGFDYLQNEGNDFLYIGDEVGLGKTYIAIGIMSLLRHFSLKKNYKDMIIVPKSNLQEKWQKEINNFIKTNWKYTDSRVKSLTNASIGLNNNDTLFQNLSINTSFNSAYLIYRMSSFSIGVNNNNWDGWRKELKNRLGDNPIALEYFEYGRENGYFRYTKDKAKIKRLKRFYAYLLNIIMPTIDCLVVDEAHNYRKGNSDADMSSRNAVTSCLFGIKKAPLKDDIFIEEGNEQLQNDFFKLIKTKAKKIIFLSATPIKNSLTDIIHQIDCFKKHKYTPENINSKLESFMIRGIMNLNINGKDFSRNQYRYEHRNGSVIEEDPGKLQKLDDDTDAITFGLFQYKLIEKLQEPRYNKSFEIGMLAGFETFSHDSKRIIEKEYEENNSSSYKTENSVDSDIVRTLIESYKNIMNVDDYPKHPKQENLVNELYNIAISQRKALVFVRRVASAYELEQRLMKKFEQEYILPRLQRINDNNAYINKDLGQLIKRFREKKNEIILPHVYKVVYERIKGIFPDKINEFLEIFTCDYYNSLTDFTNTEQEKIILWFDHIYDNDANFNEIIKKFIKQYLNSGDTFRVKSEEKSLILNLLDKKFEEWKYELIKRSEQVDSDEDKDERSENEKYFFNRYFTTNEGLSFKNRVRTQDWFEFNYFLLNRDFLTFGFDETKLVSLSFDKKIKRNKVIDKYTDVFVNSINNSKFESNTKVPEEYKNSTFLTRLITENCHSEFVSWLKTIEGKYEHPELIINEIDILEAIIKNIFRNGSGLLPAFIADKANNSFSDNLLNLISEEKYFGFVLQEIKEVLNNYTILRSTNFSDVNTLSEHSTKIHSLFRNISPIIGTTGQDGLKKTRVAAQFRLPGFPYILITTDILKEGEDLHTFCKNIYHYGIAWSPIDMEQRTGRIDRIGSLVSRLIRDDNEIKFSNNLQVFFPYISDSIEVNQVSKLFKSMNSFIETFYDFTIISDNDSTVSSEESINEIPKQNKETLKSKYEYKSNGLLEIRNIQCLKEHYSSEVMSAKIKKIYNAIESYTYFADVHSIKNHDDYSISGTFLIPSESIQTSIFKDIDLSKNGSSLRKGPFKIRLAFDAVKGNYTYKIYSKIGKCSPPEIKRIEKYINNRTKTIEVNENLLVINEIGIDSSIEEIILLLRKVVIEADVLEFCFFDGGDDQNGM